MCNSFELRPFWDKYCEWSQNDPEHYKLQGTPYHYIPESQISVHFTQWPVVLTYLPICDVHRMNPQLPCKMKGTPYMQLCVTNVTNVPASQIHVYHPFCCTTTRFWDTKLSMPVSCKFSKWLQNGFGHLQSNILCPVHINTYLRLHILSVSLVLETCKFVENWKIGNIPNDRPLLNTYQSKNTLYAWSTYPQGPNFGPFHCTIRHFPLQGCWKSEISEIIVPNDLKLTLKS